MLIPEIISNSFSKSAAHMKPKVRRKGRKKEERWGEERRGRPQVKWCGYVTSTAFQYQLYTCAFFPVSWHSDRNMRS